jgi:hypothetical protein
MTLIKIFTSVNREDIITRHKIEKSKGLTGYQIKYRPVPLKLQLKGEQDVIKVFKGHLKNGAKFLKDASTFGFEVVEILGVKDGKLIDLSVAKPKTRKTQPSNKEQSEPKIN